MPSVAPKPNCLVPDCDKLSYAKGYCVAHNARIKYGRDLLAPVQVRTKKGQPRRLCAFEGCGKVAVDPNADCLCSTHWKQKNKYKIELRETRGWVRVEGGCNFEGCGEKNAKAGLCMRHYSQAYEGRTMTNAHLRGKVDYERNCTIMNCEKTAISSALLCRQHDSICWTHKLSSVQIEMLWAYGCSICGSKEKLHIDHDHACCDRKVSGRKDFCGECVRGCLCNDCNLGIGMLRDDVARILSAVDYLLDGPRAR